MGSTPTLFRHHHLGWGCGFVYDEKAGRPEDGIQPGAPSEEVPPAWTCLDCSALKSDFDLVES